MAHFIEPPPGDLDPAQATELSLLVDLEACWENLRKPAPLPARATLHELTSRQNAYDRFRARLRAYNKRYAPAHVTELLLNTPTRLGLWCQAMRDLYRQIEHNPHAHCPAHLLEKAYRWADQIGVRMTKSLVSRATPPVTIGDVIRLLDALVQWCGDLIGVANLGPQPEIAQPVHSIEL
jgi:hypothetical protein